MRLCCRQLFIIPMLKKLAIESKKSSFQNIKLAIDSQTYSEPTKKTYYKYMQK